MVSRYIFIIIAAYIALELGVFWYRYKTLPELPAIDQSSKTFGHGPALRYIAAGDSTGVGVGASEAENTYPYKVAEFLGQTHTVEYKNIAVKGFRTEDVINKQLETIVAYNPDIITISIGANDATHLASSKKVLDNYKTIIGELEKRTTAKIYITDVANFHGASVLPWFYISLLEFRSSGLNKHILQLEDARVKIVNIHDFGWSNYPDMSKTYAADHFHPNDIGYENWANAFLDKIRKE